MKPIILITLIATVFSTTMCSAPTMKVKPREVVATKRIPSVKATTGTASTDQAKVTVPARLTVPAKLTVPAEATDPAKITHEDSPAKVTQPPQDGFYEGKKGPGEGKKIVLLAGDEEYRSEEVMPMLAKILSERHGFTCRVVWSINPPGWSEREIKDFKKANKDAPEPKPGDADPNDGTIDPNEPANLPGMEALDDADLCIMLWRFRAPREDLMKHFADYIAAGKPVIGLRTSTHAFSGVKAPYERFNSFGKDVLGEGWVSHWGSHKKEATLGIIEEHADGNPLFNGITELFGDTDVYEAHPPADATILVRGQVLKDMTADSGAADYKKKTKDGEVGVNSPMQPVVWTREHKNEAGTTNKVLCTTMGAASDMKNEAMRRLVVNATYAFTGVEVPEKANVEVVGEFAGSAYGFGGGIKGKKPKDYAK